VRGEFTTEAACPHILAHLKTFVLLPCECLAVSVTSHVQSAAGLDQTWVTSLANEIAVELKSKSRS
jgi:hypothetical protein